MTSHRSLLQNALNGISFPNIAICGYVTYTSPRFRFEPFRVVARLCNHFRHTYHNLFAALRRLRLEGYAMAFWIDSLCIDQECVDEKNAQIPLMRNIYSSARVVTIWLGEPEGALRTFLSVASVYVQRASPPVCLAVVFVCLRLKTDC